MKETEYRITNHEWYSIASSFAVVCLCFLFVATYSLLLDYTLDFEWLHFSTAGSVIKGAGAVVSLVGGTYLGFKWIRGVFDKTATMTIDDLSVTISKKGKEYQIYFTDIESVEKRIFASINDRYTKDRKFLGPMFVEYAIRTDKGVYYEYCSVAEGWEKVGKDVFNKNAFKPRYSIEDAFSPLEEIVKKRNAAIAAENNGEEE
ncbi:hypothetical protein LJB89_04850 [Tyzzerella sp. OttesenSCG-928-J15]|nr:hypothetical protein [Tyzzerella sp. OttesenSCG-928-J15]